MRWVTQLTRTQIQRLKLKRPTHHRRPEQPRRLEQVYSHEQRERHSPSRTPAPRQHTLHTSQLLASFAAPTGLGLVSVVRLLHLLLTEPLFTGLCRGLVHDAFHARRPSGGDGDESVADYVSRRWGSAPVVDHLVSAALHGLFAGDIDRLSARMLFPGLCELEEWAEARRVAGPWWKGWGGVVGEALRRPSTEQRPVRSDSTGGRARRQEEDMLRALGQGSAGQLEISLQDASVFSFKHGVEQLCWALTEKLREADNVSVLLNARVHAISRSDDGTHVMVSVMYTHSTDFPG